MRDRLGHAVEHQPDAHAGGEQHREPSHIGIVRLGIGAAETDPAIGRDHEEQAQDHEDIRRRQEEPVEARRQPVAQAFEKRPHLILKCQGENDEGNDRQPRDGEDGIVDVEAERPDLPGDVVLTDLVLGFDEIGRSVRCRLAGVF